MGLAQDPLTGFSWSPGDDRVTTGINMWSDVFLHANHRTNEKIAILVMDTQGLFDHDTPPIDNSRIFSLSTLISSIQILNLSMNVQEDELEYLHFATELAKFASQDGTHKSFQRLLFLIRDYAYTDDNINGIECGRAYLKKVLHSEAGQTAELKEVRENLKSSFDTLECFLLPSPGKKVIRKHFDGRWVDFDEDFKDELVLVIERLLHPDSLTIKRFNGKELVGSEVKKCIETFSVAFMSDTLPQPKSILESTIAAFISTIINKCFSNYKEIINGETDVEEEADLVKIHKKAEASTLKMFDDDKKMGSHDDIKKFKAQLQIEIDEYYKIWEKRMIKFIVDLKQEKLKAQQEKVRIEAENLKKIEQVEEVAKKELEAKELQRVLEKEKLEEELKQNEEAHKKALEEVKASEARTEAENKANIERIEREAEKALKEKERQQAQEKEIMEKEAKQREEEHAKALEAQKKRKKNVFDGLGDVADGIVNILKNI